MEHCFAARRQLGEHLALHTTEHEGADLRAQALRRVGLARCDGAVVALLEVTAPAEETRVGEVHDAPELLEPVLDGRAAQGDAELAAVVTYVRSSWSNKAGPITAEVFEHERKAGAARTTPFEGGAALKKLAAEKPS